MKHLNLALYSIVCLWPAVSNAVTAEEILAIQGSPEEIGQAIAAEVDERDLGFNDSIQEMKMILTNAAGDTSSREMRIKTLENTDPDDGDKSLVVFDHPRDVKGTALLSFAHFLDSDDQWLYLPALKRVKRISSRNKSGPFMGSEFAYEDMTASEMAKYTYKYLDEDFCDPNTPKLATNALILKPGCFKVERYPRYENSGYTRQIGWIDKKDFIIRRLEFYDRKNELLKTLTFGDYKQYLDKHWRSHDMFMENHQTKKQTRLTTSEMKFKTGLDEKEFNQAALKRAK